MLFVLLKVDKIRLCVEKYLKDMKTIRTMHKDQQADIANTRYNLRLEKKACDDNLLGFCILEIFYGYGFSHLGSKKIPDPKF